MLIRRCVVRILACVAYRCTTMVAMRNKSGVSNNYEIGNDANWNRVIADHEGSGVDDGDESDDGESGPLVLLGTIGELQEADVSDAFAKRPVWFFNNDHASMVGVFDRYPEPVLQGKAGDTLMSILRGYVCKHSACLQTVLGSCCMICVGYHACASLEDVVESFEDDGFDVLLGIGHLVMGGISTD